MAILNFQKPDKVIMIDSSEFEGKFEFRPLEPGYGLTVGNALRRVLLSSLEGFAITSLRIGINPEDLKSAVPFIQLAKKRNKKAAQRSSKRRAYHCTATRFYHG